MKTRDIGRPICSGLSVAMRIATSDVGATAGLQLSSLHNKWI